MLSENINLINGAIFFATIFAYQQKCVTIAQINYPKFGDGGEIQNFTVEKYYSDKLFKNYLGCFSRNILGRMVNEMSAKVILYNSLLIQSECFNPCQNYFEGYPGSLLNLIATQHHVCVCVPNYSNQRDQLHKVPDSKCSLNITYNQDIYIVGGTRTIALYGKDENIPKLNFTLGKDSDERDGYIEIQEGVKAQAVVPSPIFPSETDTLKDGDTLRIDSTGQICNYTKFRYFNDNIGIHHRPSKYLAPFLNSYIPTSFEKPDLCVDYCRSMDKYSIYNNGESNKNLSMSDFAIQSTVKAESYWNNTFERIELCSCSILTIMPHPLRIIGCSKCPSISGLGISTDNCTNLEFQHRVYKIDSDVENLVPKNFTPINNEKGPEKLYTNYLGCFSRSILERMVNENKVKVILPNPLLIQDQCFSACQSFFDEKYPRSRLNDVVNLIAIQDHVCICLPNYSDDQPGRHRKVPDSSCPIYKVLGKDLAVGGSNSIALYSNESIKLDYVYYVLSDTEQVISPHNRNLSEVLNASITSCSKESCILRVDSNGNICNNSYEPGDNSTPSALVTFLNSYIPKSEKDPYLCKDYCSSSEKNTTYNNGKSNETLLPKYFIQSTFNMQLSLDFERIELCHCTDKLSIDYPLKLEKCNNCTDDSCSSYSFDHRTYLVCPNDKQCKGIDIYGIEWLACVQETKRHKCPGSSNGTAFWTCSSKGSFDGQQPNYEDCRSQQLLDIKKKIMENSTPSTNKTNEILSDLRHLVTQPDDSEKTQYFGHDIKGILISLKNITKASAQIINATFSERENITINAIVVYGTLLATSGPWGQLSPGNRSKTATDLISGIEETLFNFTDANKNNEIQFGKSITPIEGDSSGFVVTLGEKKKSAQEDIKFPQDSETYITVSANSQLRQENVQFVGILMESKYANKLLPPTLMEIRNGENITSNKTFDGKVISLSIPNETMNQMATKKDVFVKFDHPVEGDAAESRCTPYRRRKCAYWDTTLLVWSTYGCEKLDGPSNLTATICKCNHLTAFAVLTDVNGNIKNQAGLENLTLLLCSLSIFCLIATIVILKWADKTLKFRPNYDFGEGLTITIHLCATMILSNLLMLLLVDRHYFCLPEVACVMVGMVTHYVYLAVFGWLFVQGLLLYRRMVLDVENYIRFYTIGAYCFPILPVILAAAIGYTRGDESYGSDMYCWLNGKYMWAFMGPVAVILPVNFFVMGIALRKQVKSGSYNPKLRKSRCSNNDSRLLLKGFFTMSVTLGLTWITGFFTLLDEPSYPFMAYVFTITNASQGIFMLVFNCIIHKNIKPLLLKKLGIAVEKLKGKNSSTTVQVKKTSPTGIQDKPSRITKYSVVSQADKETNETSEETLRNVKDESLDQGESKLFSGRELSTVLEYNSDSENGEESGTSLLSQTNEQQHSPKPRSQLTIGEESGNESENDKSTEGSEDEGQGPGPAYKRRRRIIGPPYLGELEESNLYLRYAGCDSEC